MSKRVLQVIGYKNSGKTTTVTKIVDFLTKRGLKLATIKHDAHGFEWDQPNTDTWQHQQSGASLTLIQSPHQLGLIAKQHTEYALEQLLIMIAMLDQYDMIIIEGYKRENYPKLVLIREQEDFELLHAQHIELVMFWQEEDRRYFLQEQQAGVYPSYPSLLIQDSDALLQWVAEYSKAGQALKEREDE